MSRRPSSVKVLGLDVPFKPGTDMERVERAARLLNDRYAEQKQKSHGRQPRDILLTFLALGLADDFLRLKTMQGDMQARMTALLEKIEKSV